MTDPSQPSDLPARLNVRTMRADRCTACCSRPAAGLQRLTRSPGSQNCSRGRACRWRSRSQTSCTTVSSKRTHTASSSCEGRCVNAESLCDQLYQEVVSSYSECLPSSRTSGSRTPSAASSRTSTATATSRARSAPTDSRLLDDLGDRQFSHVTRGGLQRLVGLFADSLAPSTVQCSLLPLRAIYKRDLSSTSRRSTIRRACASLLSAEAATGSPRPSRPRS